MVFLDIIKIIFENNKIFMKKKMMCSKHTLDITIINVILTK